MRDILQGDKLMECLDCKHQSKTWLEIENNTFINHENETEYQVYCPKCESWDYYLIED